MLDSYNQRQRTIFYYFYYAEEYFSVLYVRSNTTVLCRAKSETAMNGLASFLIHDDPTQIHRLYETAFLSTKSFTVVTKFVCVCGVSRVTSKLLKQK